MKHLSRPGINLLVLFGYSVLFIVLGGALSLDLIGLHWSIILLHALVLCGCGIGTFRDTERRPEAKRFFLSMLLVLLVGHGLCFFNGLMNFNVH